MLISKLILCSSGLRTKVEDVFHYLLSSATAVEGGRHRGDSDLEEKSLQAICFCS